MSKSKDDGILSRPLGRRQFMAYTAGAGVAAAGLSSTALAQACKTGVDPAKWTAAYIKSIAGTETYDTAAECQPDVPNAANGRLPS